MNAIEIQYTGEESLEEVINEPNPTLELISPGFEELRNGIYDFVINRHYELFQALDQAIGFAFKDYASSGQPNESQGSKEATLILCQLGRKAAVYHAGYQQIFLRAHDRLDGEVRSIVQGVLLFLLKKMEWIAKREYCNPHDPYVQCYFSTLRRYKDVALGRMIFDGKWIAIIGDGPEPVIIGAMQESPVADFAEEEATFARMLPKLLETEFRWFVAICDGEIIDKDKDEIALARRAWSKTSKNVLIKRVTPDAVRHEWHVTTPFKEV